MAGSLVTWRGPSDDPSSPAPFQRGADGRWSPFSSLGTSGDSCDTALGGHDVTGSSDGARAGRLVLDNNKARSTGDTVSLPGPRPTRPRSSIAVSTRGRPWAE